MENNYYSLNIKALTSRYSGIEEALKNYKPSELLIVKQTSSGYPTAIFEDRFIHSRHDPKREAENLIQREVSSDSSIYLFYGFGLGYLPEVFISLYPEIPCLIIEPDLSFFLKALQTRDLRRLLTHSKIVFFLETEAAKIIQYLENQNQRSLKIVKLRSLYDKNKFYYEKLDGLLKSFLRQKEINSNTLRRFGKLWIRNFIFNLPYYITTKGVTTLENSFAGIPALICAGGPSLDEILPHLKELQKKMLIIAVDTTLVILQRHGIDPPFTVIADPQYWNTRHLDGLKKTHTIVISEPSTNPRIFHLLSDNLLIYSSVFPLAKFFEELTEPKGKLLAGGSVATTAWDLTRFLGCKPIYFAGLDLGFPSKKTHVKGAFFEESFFNTAYRLCTLETKTFLYIINGFPFYITANNNTKLLTDHRMALYKAWFETQQRLHPEFKTYSIAKAGAKIEGIEYIPFTKVLELPDSLSEAKIKSLKQKLKAQPWTEKQEIKLKSKIEYLINSLTEFSYLLKDGLARLNQAENNSKPDYTLKEIFAELGLIEKNILAHPLKEVVAFLLGPILEDYLAKKNEASIEQALTESKKIYMELIQSTLYQIDLLKELKARF